MIAVTIKKTEIAWFVAELVSNRSGAVGDRHGEILQCNRS